MRETQTGYSCFAPTKWWFVMFELYLAAREGQAHWSKTAALVLAAGAKLETNKY